MRYRRTSTIVPASKWLAFGFAQVVLLSCVAACSTPPKSSELRPVPISNSPTPSFPALVQATPTPGQSSAPSSPPAVAEVAKAIARVFDKAAAIDENGPPVFLIGDFNGDGSQD